MKSGSPKESAFINYADEKILGITRRYAKRVGEDMDDEEVSADAKNVRGYREFEQVAVDVDAMVNIVWVSGTRKYLCSVGLKWPFFPILTDRPI